LRDLIPYRVLCEVLGRDLEGDRVKVLDQREERGVPGRDLPDGILLPYGCLINCLLDGQEHLVDANDREVAVLPYIVAGLTIESLRLVALVAGVLLANKDYFGLSAATPRGISMLVAIYDFFECILTHH